MCFFQYGLAFFLFQTKSSIEIKDIATHIGGHDGRKVVALLAWISTMTRDLNAVLLVVDGERRGYQRELINTLLVRASRRKQGVNHDSFEGLIECKVSRFAFCELEIVV
jgi:hypothetical protein